MAKIEHYYVIKDGRCISDYDDKEQAQKEADSIGGIVAVEYLEEPKLTEFEKAVNNRITKNLTNTLPDGTSFGVLIDNYTTKKLAAELLILAKKELCTSPWTPANYPPDSDRTVFICNDVGGYPSCIGCGYYHMNNVWLDAEDRLTHPDYWMEIPELPKEEKK